MDEFTKSDVTDDVKVKVESTSAKSSAKPFFTSEMDGELDYEAEAVETEENEENSFEKVNEDSDEDGQCTPEREEKAAESLEEGEDDGEISDDADFEEGELVDSSPQVKQPTKQVCKFFVKGLCTWGNQCRFLHMNANGKGCYNMFDRGPRLPPFFPPPVMPPPNIIPRMMNFRPRLPPPHFMPIPPHFPPFIPMPPRLPPPPPHQEEEEEEEEEGVHGSVESDWEATLQETKALVRKASKKKDDILPNRGPEYNKENNKNYRRKSKSFRYEEVYADYNSNSKNNGGVDNDWIENQYSDFTRKKRNQQNMKPFDRQHQRLDEHRDDRARSETSFSSLSFSDRSSRSPSHSPKRKSNASKRSRSRSYSRGHSSQSHSRSRSRSISRTPSRSRSISMDSVSSASSLTASRPSSVSHKSKKTYTSSLGEELKKARIKIKQEALEEPVVPEKTTDIKPLLPRLHHLLPAETQEEKPASKPVKFTFLKKNNKKILDASKIVSMDDDSKEPEPRKGVKRSISADEPQPRGKFSKSRREELIRQLQAVEDAIARKRGKV